MMEVPPIRILVVDDHPMIREGLSLSLNREADLHVAAHCGTREEALEILATQGIDFTFLDFDLGGATASGFVPLARAAGFSGPIVILTSGVPQAAISGLLADGAAGILLKSEPLEKAARCVREVMAGEPWIPQDVLSEAIRNLPAPPKPRPLSLSAREREVLHLILEGRLTKEIAGLLGVTETAIKGTIQQLFEKTGVRSRSQLVRFTFENYRDEIQLDSWG